MPVCVGVLHLAGDLDLADHLGFETGDDGEEMLDRFEAGHGTEMLVEHGGRRARRLDERAAHMERGGFVADAIGLETIAGGEQDGFGEAGFAGRGVECLGAAGRDGERGAFVESGGAMGGAQRHEVAGAFAHRAEGSERYSATSAGMKTNNEARA
jgi:hypothetical protein